LSQEIEEQELEEEDTIQTMDDKPSSSEEPPLTCAHILFGEMGITRSSTDRFLDVCSVMFDQLKNFV